MKICLIHGSLRKGSTYHVAHKIIEKLNLGIDIHIDEYFLPKDLPNFCSSCFQCIEHGEQHCPHQTFVNTIDQSLIESDLIVLTSPVYVFDVSGQMKSLLDHFAYRWLSHRPHPSMFNKVGLTVVTAAGAGLKSTTSTLHTNLFWWGISHIYHMKQAVMTSDFHSISPKILQNIEVKTAKIAQKISRKLRSENRTPSLKLWMYFQIMKKMRMNHPEWNPIDYDFWKRVGYLEKYPVWKKKNV